MLCWLIFGEHAALGREVSGVANVILTEGIHHSAGRIRPRHNSDTTHRASPWGGLNALLASIW